MRDYIGELKKLGYNLKAISSETGLSQAKLSRIKSGKAKLSSTMPEYEVIRNVSRRLSYHEARKAGLSSEKASASRRTLMSPEAETRESDSQRIVKSKQDTTRFQMRILGEFYNYKIHETKLSQGFSHAYLEIDKKLMTEEAIAEAQSKLGGSNWKLKRLIETELVEYILTSD